MTQPALPLELDARQVPRAEALRLLDNMVAATGCFADSKGELAGMMHVFGKWLRLIRPHLLPPAEPI